MDSFGRLFGNLWTSMICAFFNGGGENDRRQKRSKFPQGQAQEMSTLNLGVSSSTSSGGKMNRSWSRTLFPVEERLFLEHIIDEDSSPIVPH
jgi:hypothetical protein